MEVQLNTACRQRSPCIVVGRPRTTRTGIVDVLERDGREGMGEVSPRLADRLASTMINQDELSDASIRVRLTLSFLPPTKSEVSQNPNYGRIRGKTRYERRMIRTQDSRLTTQLSTRPSHSATAICPFYDDHASQPSHHSAAAAAAVKLTVYR